MRDDLFRVYNELVESLSKHHIQKDKDNILTSNTLGCETIDELVIKARNWYSNNVV
jgi:hypothetical protein